MLVADKWIAIIQITICLNALLGYSCATVGQYVRSEEVTVLLYVASTANVPAH